MTTDDLRPASAIRAARALYTVIEPLHNTLFFAPDVQQAWSDLGLEPRGQGYFAGRAAPMGAVGPDLVAAIFFNFNPQLVSAVLPGAWDIASPADVLQARAAAIEGLFRRLDAPFDGLDEATALAREAVAAADLQGRPLGSANAAVEPFGSPFADLWQALAVLREHRGDGHVALLTAAGCSRVESLVVFTSWQDRVSRRFLQRSRLWDEQAWAAGQQRARQRGWLDDDGALTAVGAAWRDELEHETDRLAALPYAALGPDRCQRLFALLHPLAVTVAQADDVFPRRVDLPGSYDEAAA